MRYDDEKGIEAGDEVDLLSALTDDRIGTATVKHTDTVEVCRAIDVVRGWWAEYGIQTPGELVKRLNAYYDDVIDETTKVKVIILEPDLRSLHADADRWEGDSR
ncbi:hypothetical protein AB7C87_10185 [Natrarchaeobius sp. A-rgal3]|uniref:hypothetical protein n=1 Tax=Natrarchaeobius versutus TaxID=1679078 RepID=UPI00350F8720